MPRNEHLRQKRMQQNWRQQDLADLIGTTVLSVQRWERGTHQPSLYYRTKLCTLFALSPQELGFVEETSSSPASVATPHAPSEASPPAPFERSSQQTRIWTVPYERNPLFTGREDLLASLDQHFASALSPTSPQPIRQAALTQAQAIKGLGGIGKTQIAIEYAYRCLQTERYTHTLWISAVSEETILTSFAELAALLPEIRQQGEQDERKLARSVVRWLEQCEESWLLLFDNADAIELASPYFPTRGHGDLLLTTRASAVGSFASPIEVDTMGMLEGTQLLLRRAHRLDQASDDEINEASTLVLVLGQFPLAIDQAGAYIEETGCTVQRYLQLYHQNRRTLLARRGKYARAYPDSVATTWALSFQQIEQHHPAAAQCLHLCAFLAPDHIPEELLIDGAPFWPAPLQQAVSDPLRFEEMLEALLAFSLVKRLTQERQLSIHRLVQVVQADRLPPQEQQQWVECIVRAVHILFPSPSTSDNSFTDWPLCQHYLEQAQICDTLIQQYQLHLPEAAHLLAHTGAYLGTRALYGQADTLYQRAIQLWEHLDAGESFEVAHLHTDRANLSLTQGKYSEAEGLFQQALSILELQEETAHEETAHIEEPVAREAWVQSWEEPSQALSHRALHLSEQFILLDPIVLSAFLLSLGTFYNRQDRYAEAETLYLRGLHLLEQQPVPDPFLIVSLRRGVVVLYIDQGRYGEAEPLSRQNIQLLERQQNPNFLEIAKQLRSLSHILMQQGQGAEAEALARRALTLHEQLLGSDHLDLAYSLIGLAHILTQQGTFAEAEVLCLRALAIREHLLNADNGLIASGLHELATLYRMQGRTMEAEPLYLRALAIREQQIGAESLVVSDSLRGLAILYTNQKRYEEAEPLFHRALQIREQNLGLHNAEVAQVLHDYAYFQQEQDHFPEAMMLYQRALTIREQTLGLLYPVTIETRTNLHTVLRALGRTEEVAALEIEGKLLL